MVGVNLSNKAATGEAMLCQSVQADDLSGWPVWLAEYTGRHISDISTLWLVNLCHHDQISAYQLQLPLPAQAVACEWFVTPCVSVNRGYYSTIHYVRGTVKSSMPIGAFTALMIILLFFIIINEKINVAFSQKTARTRNTHRKRRRVR